MWFFSSVSGVHDIGFIEISWTIIPLHNETPADKAGACEELSGDPDPFSAAFGVQFFGMILGFLVCLMFPGKRLKYSVSFILPIILSIIVAVVMKPLGYE